MQNILGQISILDFLVALNSTGMVALVIGGVKIYKAQKNNGGAKTTTLLHDIDGKVSILITRLDESNKRCESHLANQAREMDGVKDHLASHDEQIFKIVAG